MSEQATTPPDEPQEAMGVEPEEESGAGYGNHAPEPAAPGEESTDRERSSHSSTAARSTGTGSAGT
jgi:hypothetical protein